MTLLLVASPLARAAETPSASDTFQNTLMPEPSSLVVQPGAFTIDSTLTSGFTGVHDNVLQQATTRALNQLEYATGVAMNKSFATDPSTAKLQIRVSRAAEAVQSLDEDESYTLSVSPDHIVLQAPTDLGAMHGLQTLLQLVQQHPDGYVVPAVRIADTPRFAWRGLMIDCGRHFEPVPVILRTLDGMAAVKLNVFHWHLTEDQGFRVQSLRFPRLTGMGSDGLYYTQDQVRQVVAYAHSRGIRVVPEFDMPGHMTSWFVGYPDLASGPGPYQVQRRFGVHDPAMDPTRESTYKFLDAFLGEMAGLFPDAYMHIGGDESNGKQWMANPRIRAFMRVHGIKDAAGLQVYFNQRLLKILTKYHKHMVGWDEILAPGLPKDIVVQSWRGVASLSKGAKEGYQGILSAPYYLDGMKSAGEHYLADPIPADSDLTLSQRKLILGGEVCMWGEQISPQTIDSRIWPRTAAIAERFWSPANIRDVNDMYRRLRVMSLRLDGLGLQQISGPQRAQRQLTGEVHSPEFSVLASVLEPVSFGDRYQFQHTDQLTPLDLLVDAIVPDPPSKHDFAQTVQELLANAPGQEQRQADLAKLFESWQNTAPQLGILMQQSPRLAGDASRAQQLARLGAIGMDALHHWQSHTTAPGGWQQTELAELAKIQQQKSLVRFTVLEPLRELVMAASSGGTATPDAQDNAGN
ncbi:MAG TPA: family 20 glycosylhydrolase [Acidobacteriaceae bacterium]|jgi:hexosaminidase|nr:family 20 glycosylhydrolase [Acidobacteriaceae bacterium]